MVMVALLHIMLIYLKEVYVTNFRCEQLHNECASSFSSYMGHCGHTLHLYLRMVSDIC